MGTLGTHTDQIKTWASALKRQQIGTKSDFYLF